MILSDKSHAPLSEVRPSLSQDGEPAIVYLIDADTAVLRALSRLIRAAGLRPVTFSNEQEFFSTHLESRHACVVADLSMSGIVLLDLPGKLSERGLRLPVILLTALDSGVIRERAHRSGAAAYFRKPVDDQALLDSIRWVLSEGVDDK